MAQTFIPCNCPLTWGDHWIVTNNGLPFEIQPGLRKYGEPIQILSKDDLRTKKAQWFTPTVLISFMGDSIPILLRLSYGEMQEYAIKNRQYSEVICKDRYGIPKNNKISAHLTMPRIKIGYNMWAEAKVETKKFPLTFVFEIMLWSD